MCRGRASGYNPAHIAVPVAVLSPMKKAQS